MVAMTGSLAAGNFPEDGDIDFLLVTDGGKILRLASRGISLIGRVTQGVKLIELDSGDKLQAIASVIGEDKEDSAAGDETSK